MAFLKLSADDALADVGRFNVSILQGVFRAYISANAEVLSHNLAALETLFPASGPPPTPAQMESLCKLGLLIAPVAMPSFMTSARGAAVTYWKQSASGKLELSLGTALTGGLALQFGTETSRQQSDTWGCEITWQPGDVKQFLQAFTDLKGTIPDLDKRLEQLVTPKKE
ncbi:MAG: hypothetical protein WCP21_04115 [Armatimonadota bacterium]